MISQKTRQRNLIKELRGYAGTAPFSAITALLAVMCENEKDALLTCSDTEVARHRAYAQAYNRLHQQLVQSDLMKTNTEDE